MRGFFFFFTFSYLGAESKILYNKKFIILHRIFVIHMLNFYLEDRHYDRYVLTVTKAENGVARTYLVGKM